MSISIARAKTLCTATELALVKASGPREIGALSAAQLRQKVSRARDLRDKWRDQAERQRRTSQAKQQARQTDENARSTEKAELFAEVLTRFETRLAKSDGGASGVVPKRVTKKARSSEHRATRATVRDSLKETKLSLGAKRKTAKKVAKEASVEEAAKPSTTAKAKKDAKPKRAAKVSPAAQAATTAPKDGAPSKKRRGTSIPVPRGLAALAAMQGLSTSKRQQRSANAAAKQTRLKSAGTVRIQKHTSARNKRRQASRDSK